MTHTWTPAHRPPRTTARRQPPTRSPITGDRRGKSFSFTLVMDATDMIADGGAVEAGLASLSGVYSRLAALEMLLFPTAPPGGGLIGSVSAALGLSAGAGAVRRARCPPRSCRPCCSSGGRAASCPCASPR